MIKQLKTKGNTQRRDLFRRHGARDRLYGVSVADMKVIAKTIKGEQDLACDLYDTGNYDAMYLAGMVADGKQMTKRQLQWRRSLEPDRPAYTPARSVAPELPSCPSSPARPCFTTA